MKEIGTEQEVWDGLALHTADGLIKEDLLVEGGNVLSIRAAEVARMHRHDVEAFERLPAIETARASILRLRAVGDGYTYNSFYDAVGLNDMAARVANALLPAHMNPLRLSALMTVVAKLLMLRPRNVEGAAEAILACGLEGLE